MTVEKGKLAYSRTEAAAAVGLSEASIKRAIASGNLRELHPIKGERGERIANGVIHRDELDRWLKS